MNHHSCDIASPHPLTSELARRCTALLHSLAFLLACALRPSPFGFGPTTNHQPPASLELGKGKADFRGLIIGALSLIIDH
jgi:hypothetical protein